MRIVHYTGEGYGLMSGITEYIELLGEDEKPDAAPGFEVSSNTDLMMDLPCSLPINSILIPHI